MVHQVLGDGHDTCYIIFHLWGFSIKMCTTGRLVLNIPLHVYTDSPFSMSTGTEQGRTHLDGVFFRRWHDLRIDMKTHGKYQVMKMSMLFPGICMGLKLLG
jgi:hypothetical protein